MSKLKEIYYSEMAMPASKLGKGANKTNKISLKDIPALSNEITKIIEKHVDDQLEAFNEGKVVGLNLTKKEQQAETDNDYIGVTIDDSEIDISSILKNADVEDMRYKLETLVEGNLVGLYKKAGYDIAEFSITIDEQKALCSYEVSFDKTK